MLTPATVSTGAIDVAIDKGNPDVMLATTWDKIRDEKSRIYGPNSFVYRSTDGGHTWTNVHNAPLPQSETDPALQNPDNMQGKMGVDFSDSDPNRAYLISSTARGNFNGFFTSTDAGATWTAVGSTSTGTLQNDQRRLRLVVRPRRRRPGEPAARLRRGRQPRREPQRRPHVDDVPDAARGPARRRVRSVHGGRVYLGNDGGFYWSTANGAARGLWSKTARLPVSQFYEIDESQQDQTRVNGGTQDNSSLRSWGPGNQNDVVNGDWFAFVGGDGMMNRIDPSNDHKFYGCSQNGGCRGFAPPPTSNNGFSMTIPGARKNWVAPIEFAADPHFMFGGSENMYRMNTDVGQRVWTKISNDLTEGTEPRAPGFGTITAIGTTKADPNLVYAGTDSGLMWVSRNAMAADPTQVTWTKLPSPVFPGRWVTRDHRRQGQREDRVGELLGLALR